jgi:hypothetical protein
MLVEVKSPTDHLSYQQQAWLQYFAQMIVPAAVLHVSNLTSGHLDIHVF